ncbi:hypothetical protein HanPSC8_Chr01g0006401 [Helianthus annuus]|nr:hypothetical protein HanPSC8_Chr01g0006401 [Helianthus annuus]
MKSGLLLDVVIRQGSAIFELLSGEDQPLLVWWNTFFVLDFSFDIVNCVRALYFKSDCLSGERFNKDLHTTPQSENKVKCGFLLDVVVSEGSAVFELFSGEDKPLLVWGDSFLVLDFGFDIVDRVGALYFESDCLSGKSLNEDLHLGY